MKKINGFILALLYFFFLNSGLYALQEQTLNIGANAGWNLIRSRNGIAEIQSIRPHSVLALSSVQRRETDTSLDMYLSFDEENSNLFADKSNNYDITVSSGISKGDHRLSRIGSGAAWFSGRLIYSIGTEDPSLMEPLRVVPKSRNALFSAGKIIQDFSIEFWLFPTNMENGEHILSWTATGQNSRNEFFLQRIQLVASRNRLNWSFVNFFAISQDVRLENVNLNGFTTLLPKTWSHHLIRFDAGTGLLEYLVNGKPEDMIHVTQNARERGQVFYPFIGQGGRFILGGRFMGLLDEFKVYSRRLSDSQIYKYSPQGGRIESETIDLKNRNTTIVKIDAAGGRIFTAGGMIRNEYTESGNFQFADHSTIQFFIRASESPYSWGEWRSFTPGVELPPDIRGRYIQIAAMFYPSGDGETTPYLDNIRIMYRPDFPPRPPVYFVASARDGAVELNWRVSPDINVGGYLVYYGTSPGVYFGEGSYLGDSPIDVGMNTSVRINGLRNGTLYYFAIAAYDRQDSNYIGVFSREVTARPLRMSE